MPHAEEIRAAMRQPAGDEDARYEFARGVEESRITAEQRAQLQTMTRNILRQNAGRDLSPVFASADVGPVDVEAVAAHPIAGDLGPIDVELWRLGYVTAPAPAGVPMAAGTKRMPSAAAIAAQAARQAQRATEDAWFRKRAEDLRREAGREYVLNNWDKDLDRLEEAPQRDPRPELDELLHGRGREARARRTA